MRRLLDLIKAGVARPGVRAAADNLGWLVADKVVRLLAGVLVGFLVARYLGPDRFGALSYALAATGILMVIVEGGLDAVVKRDLLRQPESVGAIMLAAGVIRSVAAVATYGLLAAAVLAGLVEEGQPGLLLILGGLFFQPILMLPDLWLHARLDARRSVRVQLTALAAGSLARLYLILTDGSLMMFAWVTLGEGILAGVMMIWRAHRAGFRLVACGRIGGVMKALWRDSWPLMLSGLSVGIYMRVDAIMLKYMVGDTSVGVYAAATRLSEVWYFLPVALASSVLPALLRAKEGDVGAYNRKLQQYFDLSAGVAYVLAIPVALLAVPMVRLLYGEAFAGAGPILAVHIWASVFVFLGVARGQCLVNDGLSRFYAVSTLSGAVVNVGLNAVLIPRFEGLGAAWATLLSYVCAAWLSSYFHRAVRPMARLQANALLIPFRFWCYLRRL